MSDFETARDAAAKFYVDNSNDFEAHPYDFIDGADWARSWFEGDLERVKAERDELLRWKNEALMVYRPILDFQHPEMRLGESKVTTVMKFAKERDALRSLACELARAIENIKLEFRSKECSCDGEYSDGRLVGHACYFHRIESDIESAITKARAAGVLE